MDDMMYLSTDDNDTMYLGTDDNSVMSLSADEDDMGYLATDDEAGMEMDNGQITPAERKAIKENSKARHTHNNKDVLDGITAEEVKKWNGYQEYDDTEIKKALKDKVDKVDGKGLSTNDFTTEEKNKLAGLSNYDDTELREDIQESIDAIHAHENKEVLDEITEENVHAHNNKNVLDSITQEKIDEWDNLEINYTESELGLSVVDGLICQTYEEG